MRCHTVVSCRQLALGGACILANYSYGHNCAARDVKETTTVGVTFYRLSITEAKCTLWLNTIG